MSDNSRLLLIESSPLIVESVKVEDKTKLLRVEGIFGRVDEANRNNRMYAREEILREIDRTRETVLQRGMVGELDHPPDLQLHFQNVSHVITELRMDGQSIRGALEVLPTEKGKVLEALLLSNVRVGISSRGTGDFDGTTNEGVNRVVNFELITFDAVAEPSANKAYLEAVRETLIRVPRNSSTYRTNEEDIRRALDSLVERVLAGRI